MARLRFADLRPGEFERAQRRIMPEPNSGCWLWTGILDPHGYGLFAAWRQKKEIRGMAHRIMYEATKGSIPPGLCLDHKCRVRCCVNPDHLEAVTNRVNILRGVGATARHARQTHCKRGHPLTPDNLLRRKEGSRGCKTCRRLGVANKRKQLREALRPEPTKGDG